MTGGDAFKQKLITDDGLNAAILSYLVDPSRPILIEIGNGNLDVAGDVLVSTYGVEVLAQDGMATPQHHYTIMIIILLEPVE